LNPNWRDPLKRQEEREQKGIADLKVRLAASNMPLEKDVTDALCRLFITKFIDVMHHHPGFVTEDKLRSLKTTFALFNSAYKDLSQALNEFDVFSRSTGFHHRVNRAFHEELEAKIRKEQYCFSNLAHSLQDHCRRLKADWKPQGFEEHLECSFGSDGLHDFVCGLRTALHHRSMVEADWLLQSTDRGVTSHYVLNRDELVAVEKSWSARGMEALKKLPEQIDIRSLADDYFQRAGRFYAWLFTCAADHPSDVMLDYRRCWHDHEVQSARLVWRAVLNTLNKQKLDPYEHLSKYLGTEQLDRAMRFPMHSKEQVDYIIGVVDELGACTEEIRNAAYRLFGALPA
jgi:hypothetical protein